MAFAVPDLMEDLDSCPRLADSDRLSVAVAAAKGSHEAAIVYGGSGEFQGIFYPYHALFKRRPSTDRPVRQLLFTPPRFTRETSVWDVIAAMIGYHLYTIPVFGDGEPVACVTSTGILKAAMSDPDIARRMLGTFRIGEPYVVRESATIRDIYTFVRKHGNSRIVVVSPGDTVVGLLSRRDMYMALLSPPSGNRVGKTGGTRPPTYFSQDRDRQLDAPIKSYMSTTVNTASDTQPVDRTIRDLVASEYSSVVIVDRIGRPTGIISTRALLITLLGQKPGIDIPITVVDRRKAISAFRIEEMETLMKKFVAKLYRRLPIERVQLIIDTVLNPVSQAKQYELTLAVGFPDGTDMDVRAVSYSLRDGTKEAQMKLIRRLDR